MNLTKQEIIYQCSRFNQSAIKDELGLVKISDAREAMSIYAKQEALSFANWLSNENVEGRTITKLWNDYQQLFKTINNERS